MSALRRCGPRPAVAAVQERHRDEGPLLQHGRERRDVRVNCSCPYPSLHERLAAPVSLSGTNTEVTSYTCREVS